MQAEKKRRAKQLLAEAKETNELIRTVRMAKLAELYRRDEEIYEEELGKMGMAFTRSEI
jgi:hypothetical protein